MVKISTLRQWFISLSITAFVFVSTLSKAQKVIVPSLTGTLKSTISLCKGGTYEVWIINNNTSAIHDTLLLKPNFGLLFDDLGLKQGAGFIATTIIKQHGANNSSINFTKVVGGQNYYKLFFNSNSFGTTDTVKITFHLRPQCGALTTIFNTSLAGHVLLTPPYVVDTSTNNPFTFNLYKNTINATPSLFVVTPSVQISYPGIVVNTGYCTNQSDSFLVKNNICNTCNNFSNSCTNGFYSYPLAPVKNQPNSDTFNLSYPNTYLKIIEHRNEAIQYKITAIYLKTNSGNYRRIISNTSAGLKIKFDSTGLFTHDTLTFSDSILLIAKGKHYLLQNESFTFWEECELLSKNDYKKVNTSLCGAMDSTAYSTAINCKYKIIEDKDSVAACFSYNYQFNGKSKILFQDNQPDLEIERGVLNKNYCYNYQVDSTNYKNKYYAIIRNKGNLKATKIHIELACRNSNGANATNFEITKPKLLNKQFYKIKVGSSTALTPSLFTYSKKDSLIDCSLHQSNTTIDTSLWNKSTIAGKYCRIDSLLGSNGALYIDTNEAIVMIWDVSNSLSKNCSTNDLDGWLIRVNYYNQCNQSMAMQGTSYNWTNNPVFFFTNPNYISATSNAIQGPGVTQIIGLVDDDYSNAPIDVLKFKVANFTSRTLLPPYNSNYPSQNLNQAIGVKLVIGELLNVWKGDIYSAQHLGNCNQDSSAWYDKNHLKKYVRFYIDTGSLTPKMCRVMPDGIGYANTFLLSGSKKYYHYDSIGRPTALNGIKDSILAIFKTPFTNGFNVKWLSRFYVEVDVQPTCSQCSCPYNPYTGGSSIALDSSNKTGGSKTPVDISILHIPCYSCGFDTIGKDASKFLMPKNSYCINHGGGAIIVQCPGCKIAGLYTINAKGSRLNFGYEDNDNNSVADYPTKKIIFNQVGFYPILSSPNVTVDNSSIMYHDLYRVRHKSIIHMDDFVSSNYYPTAQTLNLIDSTYSTTHETGFKYAYLRVKTSSASKPFNANNGGNSIVTNIPALIVWIKESDTVNHFTNRLGFNSFHQKNYTHTQYYSVGGKTDTIAPIFIYYDITRDYRDTAKKEYVYDFSMDRLNAAYKTQYGTTDDLPFKHFHNGMEIYLDASFILAKNDGHADPLNEEALVTRAYCTLSPETPQNFNRFFDMQDATDQIAYHKSKPSVFITSPALLDSLCPMNNSPYPIIVDTKVKNSCDSVRWYCVKGEADFKRIGFTFQSNKFKNYSSGNTCMYSDFCGTSISNLSLDEKHMHYFCLGTGVVNQNGGIGTPTSFLNEYRHWNHVKKFEIKGLPQGSYIDSIYIIHPTSPQTITINKPFVYKDTSSNSWIVNFDSINAKSPNCYLKSLDSLQAMDDNEVSKYLFKIKYTNCSDSTYCIKIREFDEFDICDLDDGIANQTVPACNLPIDTIPFYAAQNFNNGFGFPFSTNINTCKNERIFEETYNLKTSSKGGLTANSQAATLRDGHAIWNNIAITQSAMNGDNPWVCIQFPINWNDDSTTVDSIAINGFGLQHFPNGKINGVKYPKHIGNHTWLFYLPTTSPAMRWNNQNYNSNNNYTNILYISAHYNCVTKLTNKDSVILRAGVMCDTAMFKSVTDVTSLFNNSCERMTSNLGITIHNPQFTADEVDGNNNQISLCSPFKMQFKLENLGDDCIHQLNMNMNLPSGYQLDNSINFNGKTFVGKNAVVIYNTDTSYFLLQDSVLYHFRFASTCCNDTASLPGALQSNCALPDTCLVIVALRDSCFITYLPIVTDFGGAGVCGNTNFPKSKKVISYPLLQNKSNFINKLQPIIKPDSTFISNCSSPDSLNIILSSLMTPNTCMGDSIMGATNYLLVHLPKGYQLQNAMYRSLLLKDTNATAICSSALTGFSSSDLIIDLTSLSGKKIKSLSPISLHFSVDSSAKCIDTFKAVLITKVSVTCGGTSACSNCQAQTLPVSKLLELRIKIPSVVPIAKSCADSLIISLKDTCNAYQLWSVPSPTSLLKKGNHYILKGTGNFTLFAQNKLFTNGVCVSDTSKPIIDTLYPPLNFTVTLDTALDCQHKKAQVKFLTSNNSSPFHLSVTSEKVRLFNFPTLNYNSINLKNLYAGIDTFKLSNKVGCKSTQVLKIPFSPICGKDTLCKDEVIAYSISKVNGAKFYKWTVTGGSFNTPSNLTPALQVGVHWTKDSIQILKVYAIATDSTTIIDSQFILINVQPIPHPILKLKTGTYGCTIHEFSLNEDCWEFCDSATIKIAATPSPNCIRKWSSVGNTILSGQNTDSITLQLNHLGFTSVTLIDSNIIAGCTQTVSHCIRILKSPRTKIKSLPTAIHDTIRTCLHQSIVLQDMSTTDPMVTNFFTWYDGKTYSSPTRFTSPHSIKTIQYDTAGIYHVKLVVKNNCSCADTSFLTVIVDSTSGASIFCSTTSCMPDTATYYTNVLSCGLYNWSVIGGTIISPIAYTHSPVIQVAWNNTAMTSGTIGLSVVNCPGFLCNGTSYISIPFIPHTLNITGVDTICPNSTATYSVPSISGVSYSWMINGVPQTNQTSNSINLSVPASGTYTIDLLYTSCILGCNGKSDSTKTVVVDTTHPYKIICATGKTCSPICNNDTSFLTTNFPTIPFNWYVYDPVNRIVDSLHNATSYTVNWNAISNSISATTQFTVAAIPTSGSVLCTKGFSTYTVTVHPAPPALTANGITANACICRNTTFSLQGNSGSGNQLQWQIGTIGAGTVSPTNAASNQLITTASGTNYSTVYQVSVKQKMNNAPFCSSVAYSFTIPTCQPPTPYIAGDTAACINMSSYLIAPKGFDNYNWSLMNNSDGTIVGGQGTDSIVIQWNAPLGGAYYSLPSNPNIKLELKYCGALVATVYYAVDIRNSNTIVVAGQRALCTGTSVAYTVANVGTGSCPLTGNYIWDFGDGTIQTTTTPVSPNHTYTVAGNFTVQVTAQNAYSTQQIQTDTFAIQVLQGIQAVVNLSGTNTCPNYWLQAHINSGIASSYQWYFKANGSSTTNAIMGAIIDSIQATAQGLYLVQVVGTNGCSTQASYSVQCTTPPAPPAPSGCPLHYLITEGVQSVNPCNGLAVFQFSMAYLAGSPYTYYEFNAGDGTASTSSVPLSSNFNYQYQHAGTYQASFKVYYPLGTGTCYNIKVVNVIVPRIVKNSMSYLCTPQLTATAHDLSESILVNDSAFNWKISPTCVVLDSSGNDCSYAVTPGTFYMIQYNYGNGGSSCPANIFKATPSLPSASYSINPSTNVCELTPVLFNDLSTPSSHIIGWNWTWKDKYISFPTLNTIQSNLQNPWEAFHYRNYFGQLGKVDITLNVVDDHLCQSTINGVYHVNENTLQPFLQTSNVKLSMMSSNCFGINDSIKVEVKDPAVVIQPNFYSPFNDTLNQFTQGFGMQTVGTFSSISANPFYIPVSTTGCYYVTVSNTNLCTAQSQNGVFPSFHAVPSIHITSTKDTMCAADEVKFDMDAGANYLYHWSISPTTGISGMVTNSSLATWQILTHRINPTTNQTYTIYGTITDTTGGKNCPITDSVKLFVYANPSVTITVNKTNYCLTGNDSVTLTANPTNGNSPYIYSWTGNAVNQITVKNAGYYECSVTDSKGCKSYAASYILQSPPDVSEILSGCITKCDTAILCNPYVSPMNSSSNPWKLGNNYVPTAWLLGVKNSLITSQSGLYTYEHCQGTCCVTSAPLDITILDCKHCCASDTGVIDTMYCVGMINGNVKYFFKMRLKNNCTKNVDSLMITDNNGGTIRQLYQTNLLPGWNVVTGIYEGSNGGTFSPAWLKYYFNTQTGGFDMLCDIANLPAYNYASCNVPQPCNWDIQVSRAECDSLNMTTGNPHISIQLDIQNLPQGASNVFITCPQGNITYNSLVGNSIPANTPPFIVRLGIDDLPSYDGIFTLFISAYDIQSSQICQQSLVIPIELFRCMPIDTCGLNTNNWKVNCNGYDNFGNPQYTITCDITNPYTIPYQVSLGNVGFSGTSTGSVTNVTPTYISTGTHTLTFDYTDLTSNGNGQACFFVMLKDTATRRYCLEYDDIHNCVQLIPGCPRIGHPHSQHQSTIPAITEVKHTDNNCVVKIVPNPNNGRPQIYYKFVKDVEQFANRKNDFKMTIMETSSGKLVWSKSVDNAAGLFMWNEQNSLAVGHYIVALMNGNKVICYAAMEVIQ
jgi:PKD repeat protein